MPRRLPSLMGPLVLLVCAPASAEVVFDGLKPGFQELTLLRGSMDFTLVHPLKILHGHVEGLTAHVRLNPEDLKQGIHLVIRGKRNALSFDENDGTALVSKISPTDWSFDSRALFLTLDGKFTFAGWFSSDKVSHPLTLPTALCEVEFMAMRCKFDDTYDVSKWGWNIPQLMMLPISPKISFRAGLEFGQKANP